jgi:hypothetical protein
VAAGPVERAALLLFAETARALHQLLAATPSLDHVHRVPLLRRVERMVSWLEGGRSDTGFAPTGLCRAFGAALAAMAPAAPVTAPVMAPAMVLTRAPDQRPGPTPRRRRVVRSPSSATPEPQRNGARLGHGRRRGDAGVREVGEDAVEAEREVVGHLGLRVGEPIAAGVVTEGL